MKRYLKIQLAAISILSAVFFSCRTMADVDFLSVDTEIRNNNYAQAADILNSDAKYYTKHDTVLTYLDQGVLRHFAGDFNSSNEYLSKAEKEIDEKFTKSITQAIGTGIINDTVQDYAGETFENIYTNIFMCLNYLHLKKFEDAEVEIKRFDNKMKLVGTEYEEVLQSQRGKLESGEGFAVDSTVNFHNSAFARYLSLLIYRTEGDTSNAELDYKKIQEAFALQKDIYNFDIPESIKDDLVLPKNEARVNLISFIGYSPLKQETEIRIPFRGAYYKQALPVMTDRASAISAVQVVMTNKTTGEVFKAPYKRIETISNVINDTYKQHFAAIYCRSTLRSIGKSTGSGILSVGSEVANNSGTKLLFGMLSLTSQIATEATERADVRMCRYFPGNVCIAGMTVPDGTYDVTITYYSSSGRILYSQIVENYHAKRGELNLIESVCQK